MGISPFRVSKIVRLNDLFHRIHITLDIVELLWLQVLFLRIDARPDDFTRHVTLANARHLRGEGGIVVVESINAQQVATRHITSIDITLFQLRDIHTVLTTLDSLGQNIDATIFAVESQFHHLCSWSPMPHVTPQLESQRITYCRHITIWCQQHPVTMGRHSQQGRIHLFTILRTKFDGVFLLVESQRAVATQLDADGTIIAIHLHMSHHLLLSIQRC